MKDNKKCDEKGRSENPNTSFIQNTEKTKGVRSFCASVKPVAESIHTVFHFRIFCVYNEGGEMTETDVNYENMHA